MKATRHILATLLCFLGSLYPGMAQSPFIQQYTAFNGLPSNVVYYLYQDSNRFIWLATDAGVAKFDGSHFTYYRTMDGMHSNMVIRIKEDAQQRIWFFYLDGSVGYYHSGLIHNAENTPFLARIIGDNIICDFMEDENHELYFYSFLDDAIFLLDTAGQVTRIDVYDDGSNTPAARAQFRSTVVKHLYRSTENTYYIWHWQGLIRANKLTDEFQTLYTFDAIRNVYPTYDHKIHLDVPGRGIFLADTRDAGGVSLLDSITPDAFGGSLNISSVYTDSNHITWVLTFDKGIYCFRDGMFVRHFDINACQAIVEDHEKNIWISTMNNGVYRIDPLVNSCLHFGFPGPGAQTVSTLARHIEGGVWLSNGQYIALIRDTKPYRLDYHTNGRFVNQLMHLETNTLLVNMLSSDAELLSGIQQDDQRRLVRIHKIDRAPLASKRFVLSRNNKELISYNSRNLYVHNLDDLFVTYDHIRLESRIQHAWYDTYDRLIINARQNYLFTDHQIHTQDELSRFDDKIISEHLVINDSTELFLMEGDSIFIKQNKQFYSLLDFRARDIDMRILHADHAGDMLFLATSGQVYIIDSLTRALQGQNPVVSGLSVGFRNIHDMLYDGGYLHIASDDGLTMIRVDGIKQAGADPPIPYFLPVEINDSLWASTPHQIRLRGSNKLKINFGSINYSGTPVHFSYMLSEHDAAWSTQSSNHVVYQNLPRGEYQFLLKVKKPGSGWSEPIICAIEVRPEFWQHPLFYVFLVMVISGLLYFFIVRRKYAEIRRKETEHQLIMLEQKALQSMMNPHFIFNALGSIQNYLLQNKASDAGRYLSQFARLIRQNLSAINASFIPLHDELERLRNYVQLEQLRFAEEFSFQIDIDEKVDEKNVKIPSMMLQPVIENAIWHGISGLDHDGHIILTVSTHAPSALRITVEDNGPGMAGSAFEKLPGEDHLHLGMSLMKKRLDILGRKMGVDTILCTEDAVPGAEQPGTRVTLVVPFVQES